MVSFHHCKYLCKFNCDIDAAVLLRWTKGPGCWKLVGHSRVIIALHVPSTLSAFSWAPASGFCHRRASENDTGDKKSKLSWCCLLWLLSYCSVVQALVSEASCCIKAYWIYRSCALVSLIWIYHYPKIHTLQSETGTGFFVWHLKGVPTSNWNFVLKW